MNLYNGIISDPFVAGLDWLSKLFSRKVTKHFIIYSTKKNSYQSNIFISEKFAKFWMQTIVTTNSVNGISFSVSTVIRTPIPWFNGKWR